MKKLKSLGFVFLLAVCICISILPAFADNNLEPLDTPSWAQWNHDDGAYATFENIEDAQGIYSIEVYRNGKLWKTINSGARNPIVNGRSAMWRWIEESGSYKFRVIARGDGVTYSDSEWSGFSEEYGYKKPDKAFGNVQNLLWSVNEPGIVEWDPPANMADIPESSRESLRYFVKLFKDGEEVWGMYNITDTACDLRGWIDEEAEYVCKVQAQSRDIEVVTHGKWVESNPYVVDEDVISAEIGSELDAIFLQFSSVNEEGELDSPYNALAALEKVDL